MSKQDARPQRKKETKLSLRQIIKLCAEDAAAADASADLIPERATDAHIRAYLAAHNIPEHEPLEAYGLGFLSGVEHAHSKRSPPIRPAPRRQPQAATCSPRASTGTRLEQGGCRFLFRKLARAQLPDRWRWAIAIPFLLIIVVTIFVARTPERQTRTSSCAPRGQHTQVSLPDGSTVALNTGSCVSALLSTKARSLQLESGEAVFQVASDRNRPFTVKVGHIQIRVLGTRFDVYGGETSPYTGERGTRIAVLDGAVQVTRDDTSAQSTIHLAAGEQIEIPDDRTKVAQLRHITEPAAGRLTAWQRGEIEFADEPLGEILAEYARYQPIQFYSKDAEILNRRFSGVLQTNDVAHLLRLLEDQCIQSMYKDGGRTIVLRRTGRKRDGGICQRCSDSDRPKHHLKDCR